nr:hypothetical protein [Tanacetum cinerariifolium]
MRVASVNGKKYILVFVDDYSRFTWVKCLRSKDEAPNFIIKFLKMIQLWLKTPVKRIKIDNETEFVNQTVHEYYEKVGISHETFVAHTLQQNGVVKRHKRTLIEAAHTMLIYAKVSLFLWAEIAATASDIGIFIGYAPTKKVFRIYNRRTRRIIETIHVDFEELTAMAFKHSSLEPALHEMTHSTISSRLVPNPPPLTLFVSPLRTAWDLLFQLLFDELLTSSPSFDHPAPKVITLITEVVALDVATSTGSLPQQLLTKMHHHLVTLRQHLKFNLQSFLIAIRKPTNLENDSSKPVVTLVYSRKPRKTKTNVPVSKPNIIKSISANSTIKFGNDHVAKITGYGIIRLGMLRCQGFTTWKDMDTTYTPLGNSVIRTLKFLFINTPAT